jgi:hypothetical protein
LETTCLRLRLRGRYGKSSEKAIAAVMRVTSKLAKRNESGKTALSVVLQDVAE